MMWILAMLPLLFVCTDSQEGTQRTFTIGAVLSSEYHGQVFQQAIYETNKNVSRSAKIQFDSTYIVMDVNPIHAASDICDSLISKGVYVVIASHAPNSSLSPMAVSFTCGFYQIPVIGITARDSAFSDKNVHTSFLRTVAPYSDQARVWIDLVRMFDWKRVVIMHSSDEEGRAMLGKVRHQAEDKGVEVEKNIQYTAGQSRFQEEMEALETSRARIVLLQADEEDARIIYEEAMLLNLTGSDFVWIVTEQALKPDNVPIGVLGLRQVDSDNEEGHIQDSVRIVVQGFLELVENENISEAPSNCGEEALHFDSGQTIFRYLLKQKLEDGVTGLVEFSDDGDRTNPAYEIINIQGNEQDAIIGFYGKYKVDSISMHDQNIVWPGNQTVKPKGIKISTHLRAVTIAEVPFIYAEPGSSCDSTLSKIPCPRPNSKTGQVEPFCCYGYAIDLLMRLASTVNFTYDLHLAEDGRYGSLERKNGSEQSWNGMIGEIINGQADVIVAPLTINPERAMYIDFSKPYKYQGLTILVRKTIKDSSLASFLQPFQDTLWILVGLSVHVVGLVLYLLDRFSPFGRFKLAKSEDTEEDALNLSSAMWFAWGVLLNSGIGEGTPRSFSARVLGMVWAGFAMIIVASYTANLAAFLVLDRPEASISGIDDPRLRNPQDSFKYATVRDSAVSMYFKRQVELSTMYRTMERHIYLKPEEAINAVKQRAIQAFIWDSSRLEYEAANDCELVTAGELFGRSGYGIGLPKDSPWTHDFSLAVLSFHEYGYMEQLDGKWILVKDTKCPEKDITPATLGLTNMAGVFMMVAGGIVAGIFLILMEIAYKRRRGLKEKELELAKTAADRWRGNIEKRRTLRRTMLQQQINRNKSNGMTGSPAHVGALGAFKAAPGSSRTTPNTVAPLAPAPLNIGQSSDLKLRKISDIPLV